MRLVNALWQDECGLILSAEVVTIGTLGVLGAVVGLNAASTAVDQELKEFASAIRSLDQSYGYVGHQSCRAWTAGSFYRQPDVQQSLNDLCSDGATDIVAIQRHVESQRKAVLPAFGPEDANAPRPNQIPGAKKGDVDQERTKPTNPKKGQASPNSED